jgi:hypothetical protein
MYLIVAMFGSFYLLPELNIQYLALLFNQLFLAPEEYPLFEGLFKNQCIPFSEIIVYLQCNILII